MFGRPATTTLFPYTTLFRSVEQQVDAPGDQILLREVDASIRDKQKTRGSFCLSLIEASTSRDRKSTRLNSSHSQISYAALCSKKKNIAAGHNRLRRGRRHAL